MSLGTPLTRRELDVVRSLLAGHVTTADMGKALGIDARTVESHLTHIYAKSGAINLADLMLMALGRKPSAVDFDIAWEWHVAR